MKWTQRQTIAGGVLLAAAAALIADRLTAGGSTDAAVSADNSAVAVVVAADAAVPVARPTAAAAPAARPPTTSTAGTAAALLAQRLDRVAAAEGLEPGRTTDGFRPPDAWFAGRGSKSDVKAVVEDRATTFKARHKLTAVMRGGANGGRSVAVLTGPAGGMTLRVGQAVDGFTLTAVRDAAVLFVNGDDQAELVLDRPAFSSVPMGH